MVRIDSGESLGFLGGFAIRLNVIANIDFKMPDSKAIYAKLRGNGYSAFVHGNVTFANL